MSGTNAQRKAQRKAQKNASQASIAASYEKKRVKKEERAKRLQAIETLRLQRLYNLNKRMVVIFANVNGVIVILTMVDPALMLSSTSNSYIVYGDMNKWRRLAMKASYNPRGTRTNKSDFKSYTVSTTDGSNFNFVDKDGKVLSFETFMEYESLVGQTVSDVQVDQWLYDPREVGSDENTTMIHEELLKIIEEDKTYLAANPSLKNYILYHHSPFA